MTDFLEAILRGLGTGSIYALLALGFVIIYKSTGVISFAQPALMLTGATVTSYVAPALGVIAFASLSFFISLAAAAVITAVIALVIERAAIRPMVGRPVVVVAIITIGIDIVVRVVSGGFIGTGARPVDNPWGLQRVTVLGLTVQERHLVTLAVLVVVVSALVWFYRFTRHGLAMRAAAFDQEAALTQVALPAIILGGLDSLPGAVIGGLSVGIVESLVGSYQRDVAPWLGDNFAIVSPYVLMLLVLLVRPYGLFGTPEVRRV